MKIAYATSEFVTEEAKGGQATYLANISRIFAQKGHEVFIVVLSDKDEEFVWDKNITVCRVAFNSKVRDRRVYKWSLLRRTAQFFWNMFGRSFAINKKIVELYKSHRIEIVQYSNLRGITVIRHRHIPSVLRLSDFGPYWRMALKEEFDIKQFGKNFSLDDKIRFWSFKSMDYIFAPSKVVAEATEKVIKKKVFVIESPFWGQTILEKPLFWEKQLAGKRYLLFFGTMNFLKGIHNIAVILDKILEQYKDLYFVFLGPSDTVPSKGREISAKEYILECVKKNANRVFFLHPIYAKGQSNYVISNAEACVLPSRIDNLPNTCIEAMFLGKVVIGTEGASFEQLLTDGYNGFLCERDNPESLMKCIDKVMDMSEEEKEIFGKRAQERVSEMAPEKIYNQLISVYKRVIQEAKR